MTQKKKIMKKILLLLVLLVITSCKKTESENSLKVGMPTNFVKTFEGKISEKFDIIMKLTAENGIVNGTYYYKKVGENIQLKGELQNNGELVLNEYDSSGNQTGIFKGKITENSKIEGNWSKPNGEKEMAFKLLESNTSYSSEQNSIKDKLNFENISGTYYSPFNDDENYNGETEIVVLENQKFKFEITVAKSTGCTGQIEGIGTLDKNGVGTFSNNDCEKLTFNFYEKKVKITETNCDGMHGMNCYFEGEYNRK